MENELEKSVSLENYNLILNVSQINKHVSNFIYSNLNKFQRDLIIYFCQNYFYCHSKVEYKKNDYYLILIKKDNRSDEQYRMIFELMDTIIRKLLEEEKTNRILVLNANSLEDAEKTKFKIFIKDTLDNLNIKKNLYSFFHIHCRCNQENGKRVIDNYEFNLCKKFIA